MRRIKMNFRLLPTQLRPSSFQHVVRDHFVQISVFLDRRFRQGLLKTSRRSTCIGTVPKGQLRIAQDAVLGKVNHRDQSRRDG